jgi:hypothetical protein
MQQYRPDELTEQKISSQQLAEIAFDANASDAKLIDRHLQENIIKYLRHVSHSHNDTTKGLNTDTTSGLNAGLLLTTLRVAIVTVGGVIYVKSNNHDAASDRQ